MSTSERARLAALSRHRRADDPELIAERTRLRAKQLEDHVRSVVETAPPLSDEQRARIADLLNTHRSSS